MARCIYCLNVDPEKFLGREHVIPESFGTFGSATPTLKCVCDECNTYFKKELDQFFARESLEGITRYRKGISSRESRRQNAIKLLLGRFPKLEKFEGAAVWIDGTTGKIMPPDAQVHFKNEKGEYEIFFKHQLPELDWKAQKLSDKGLKLYASSPESYSELITELGRIGINYVEKESFIFSAEGSDEETLSGEIQIEGTVDARYRRAMAKILLNFAAKYIGAEEIFKNPWEQARRFVRYGDNPLRARAHTGPFWVQESQNRRFEDRGYNLRIECIDGNTVGSLQFFNLYTHQIILAEDYCLDPEKEIAMRFVPDTEPLRAKKRRIGTTW